MADAYFNHGRWVIDCPNCNGGIRADRDADGNPVPDGGRVTCRDCGHTYKAKFPNGKEQAEQVMAQRPIQNQNWFPDTETLADLKAENALRGHRF
jgi:DNA-directed RNA polymerase subunit M/transcription elongation factor TFIIS